MQLGIVGLGRMGDNIAQHSFADCMLSAMRKGFGGHIEPKGL